MTFSGSIVAIVTPFKDDKVNYDKLGELLQFHKDNGTSCIVPCGTTGESPTLDHAENIEVIKFVTQECRRLGLQVMAGTGSNSTKEAVYMTQQAKECGADGALIVVPYYNKPCPEGLAYHYGELNRIGIPLVLYNIPGRCGINVSVETTINIHKKCPNLVAVKAANGDLVEISELAAYGKLAILSGDDALTLPIMSVGGTGVVSVLANCMPREVADLVEFVKVGKLREAQALNNRLLPLMMALLRFGPNPCPIKGLMNALGYDVGELRGPLHQVSAAKLTSLKDMYHSVKA